MKVVAKYVFGRGYELHLDGEVIWSDEVVHHAPEDVTVGRNLGALLERLGIEIEFEEE